MHDHAVKTHMFNLLCMRGMTDPARPRLQAGDNEAGDNESGLSSLAGSAPRPSLRRRRQPLRAAHTAPALAAGAGGAGGGPAALAARRKLAALEAELLDAQDTVKRALRRSESPERPCSHAAEVRAACYRTGNEGGYHRPERPLSGAAGDCPLLGCAADEICASSFFCPHQ